ncbi:hypothetical protein NMG60_11007782 [Bertholletia excelsa]
MASAPPPPRRQRPCDSVAIDINPVSTMGMQIAIMLVLSHMFQLVFKPLGQPSPVTHILSGFVVGPSVLSRINYFTQIFLQNTAAESYKTMEMIARVIIMFRVGLVADFGYLVRNLRRASIIAGCACLMCSVFAGAITPFIHQSSGATGSNYLMALMIAAFFSSSGSPIMIRMASEFKFATTDFGRLAQASALLCDLYSVVLLVLISKFENGVPLGKWIIFGLLATMVLAGVIALNVYLSNWLNRKNRYQKHLKNTEVFGILSLVVVTAMTIETAGYNSMIACFLMGSMFPKGGKTARTLVPKMNYAVHYFVLPVYLGYVGFQADLTSVQSFLHVCILVLVILLSIGGKITGTLLACHYMKIPLNEGVLFAFLTNMKGYIDMEVISIAIQNQAIRGATFYSLMRLSLVITTLLLGPIMAFMVKRENDYLGYSHVTLEWRDPENELRLLACVHNPRYVSTVIGLFASLRGFEKSHITPYLLHLIELPEKKKTTLMYHQREDDELSVEDDDYGGNDVLEINDAVDNFTVETELMVHQAKAVSSFADMHVDVCDKAEEVRASIVLLPFHKHRRIDGKMETGKEGIRTTNQKVLRHAKCTVGILVDRGLSKASQSSGSESLQHVAVLFFGGPDDREALGFSRRLIMNHHINLTIIRFLPGSTKNKNMGFTIAHREEDVLMAVGDQESESESDTAIIAEFYNRYVMTGQIGYVEKFVENGAESASVLRDMKDMYSMFIVGRSGRGPSPLTIGMSDWEECPELGTVGDFLASSDFENSGSVLVIQQHRLSNNEDER